MSNMLDEWFASWVLGTANDGQKQSLVEISRSKGLWGQLGVEVPPLADLLQLSQRLLPLQSLGQVVAAGIVVRLRPLRAAELWLTLVPLCWTLLRLLQESRPAGRRLLVGVSGAPGAGKSVFSASLAVAVNCAFGASSGAASDGGRRCIVLGMDAYHRPNDWLETHFTECTAADGSPAQVAMKAFKGAPDTFDLAAFIADLGRLQSQPDTTITLPVYDRTLHDPVQNALSVEPNHQIVIVEGMFLLHDAGGFETIKNYLDYNMFIETSEEDCHKHLVERKLRTGRSLAEAEAHYLRVDKPNLLRLAAGKQRAHVTLANMFG
eukprot:TRINITY_DN7102_c0_g1_i1.p1 TRINITY_DN7102_c0_g1~~TRINITY_DN7102_c0_g1_i1.p1  ORF type:complete len:355 (-),score=78.84 TRINITY_DN7102_c0_g1_i1:121-1083(-)